MEYKKWIHMVSFLLTVVGGLNWGLVGLLKFNLVSTLLGVGTTLEMLVYVLVGLSSLYLLVTHKGDCKMCGGK
jgi:uncharacterized membrane protein YuzA (DUF378 family)